MENVNYESDDVYTSITKYVNVAEVLNRGFELEAKAVFNAVYSQRFGTISQSKYGEGFDDEAIVSNYREKGKKVMYIPSGTFFYRLGYRVPKLFPWSDKGGNVSVIICGAEVRLL